MASSNGRIAKFIANAGICSRREAERLINAGCVKVDGEIITSPALNVGDQNIIEVNNKIINSNVTKKLWIYYKPVGLITTHNDPQNRPTVFEYLKDKLPRIISIGRLDLNSEGLLLLTNNGEIANKMERSDLERVYKVRALGTPNSFTIFNSKKIIIDDIIYRPKSISLIDERDKSNAWYEVILTEGKNREIRKIFEHFGLKVNRLIRTSYGSYQLGDLKPNAYREVKFIIDKNL